jgi:SAM-dependent methyltransferase
MSDTNTVFNEYSDYYDLFYEHKKYALEAADVIDILKEHRPEAKEIVELGSGTGNYSKYFCQAGYHVTGIEKSSSMIAHAKNKFIKNFTPICADMVLFDTGKRFDAAISLFDVICYLTNTDDIITCFKNVARHLNEGGVFIFDAWYTPAVYCTIPTPSVKRLENDEYHITRIGEPIIKYAQNVVDVNYDFFIKNKIDNSYHTLAEIHTLRHFNVNEIELFAQLSGFKLVSAHELLTGNKPGKETWKICYLLKKI